MFGIQVSRVLAMGILAGLALSAAGCSSFHRKWREAANLNPTGTGMSGRWEGQWKSSANGHSGRLRCLISQRGEGLYESNYQAKFWKLFTFHYSVPLRTDQLQAPFKFSGEANLGWWAGGHYQYEGIVDSNTFNATYSSKADRGVFKMSRQ